MKAIDYWEQAAKAALKASAELEAMSALHNAIGLIGEVDHSPEVERKDLGVPQSLGDIRWVMDSFGVREGVVCNYRRALEFAERAGVSAGAQTKLATSTRRFTIAAAWIAETVFGPATAQ